MDPERWRRIQQVFDAALELPLEQRTEYVARAAGEDDELRRQVERLIVEDSDPETFIARPEAIAAMVQETLDDASEKIPERLGEFRIRGLLGGGGMGVVYLAEQESLGREVALKLIKPEQLFFPGMRERFRREVETVARMGHPGIVPIYSVGEEDGVPYFAMERVVGCTLQDVIEFLADRDPSRLSGESLAEAVSRSVENADRETTDLSRGYLFEGSWEETCLRIVRSVANALEHAHQRGVVHRDIKPSNVMITPGGRVLLLDFGVSSAESSERMTQSGSRVGSLLYMPPEQLRGETDATGLHCDIYSLGVMLYELLTLRNPFRAEGETQDTTLSAIQEGRYPPPRRVNPGISWEAETVCVTAMDRDPARRYRSAADFANDLGNVLEKRPIQARRAGVLLRSRRWAERHPAWAVALLLGLGALVIAPLGYAYAQAEALAEALRQKSRASQNLEKAMGAVEGMLTRVGSERLASTPQLTELRRELLEDALATMNELLIGQQDDPRVRLQTARTQLKVALLRVVLGEVDAARRDFEQAIEQFERLIDDTEIRRDAETGLARAWHGLAGVHLHKLDPEQSERSLDRAIALMEPLRAQFPHVGELCVQLGRMRLARCQLILGRGDLEELEPRIDELLEDLYTLGGVAAGDWQVTQLTTAGHRMRARVFNSMRRIDDAVAELEAAVGIARRSARLYPDEVGAKESLSRALMELAQINSFNDRLEAAVAPHEEALELRRELVADYPARPSPRIELAIGLIVQGDMTADAQEAQELFEEAASLLRRLCGEYPGTVEYLVHFAAASGSVGDACLRAERLRDAAPWYIEAIQTLEEILAKNPNDGVSQAQLGLNLDGLASVRLAEGEAELAAELAGRALEELARAATANPMETRNEFWRFEVAMNRVKALVAMGDHEAAAAEIEVRCREHEEEPTAAANAAEILLTCRELAFVDPALSEAERARVAEDYARRAVRALGITRDRASAAAFEALLQLEVFDPLRERDDFLRLAEH